LVRIYIVDAFTKEPFEGNRAGVVYWANELPENVIKGIATEISSSETVFIYRSPKGAPRLRFITPTGVEVDACGHATIAALHILREAISSRV